MGTRQTRAKDSKGGVLTVKESDVGGTVPTELGINPVSVTVMAATRTTTMGVEDDNDDDDDDGEDVRRSQWWVGEKRTSPAASLTRLRKPNTRTHSCPGYT